jgi:superfamily II DNA or RNA helicase
MADLTITSGSHFVKITKMTPRGRIVVENFIRRFVQMGWMRTGRSYIKAALKVFAMATADRSEMRIHINTLKEFNTHLIANYINEDMVVRETLPIPEPVKVEFKIQSHWSDRDYQIPVIDYLIDKKPPIAKFVDLRPGRGKSYSSMRAMQELGLRTLIIVKPMYLEKWVEDIHRTMDINDDDIVVIRGSNQLMALLMLAEQGKLTAKIILISNKTMQNWIKYYEKLNTETISMGYACLPEDLCKHIGAGIRLIDELHQDFHLNYKIMLVTNVYMSMSLSATLISDDDFINKMYEITYPAITRYSEGAVDKYVAITAVFYKLKYPDRMKCKDYVSKSYSHHMFEQTILRNDQMTTNYLNLIKETFDGSFIRDYKKGQRCLIFCISIDMCTVVTNFLKNKYPHLNIGRYVEEDTFEALMTNDVSVSTLQSAGTAVDIDMLSTVIMTTAISSSQSNVQSFGRLRPLKDGSVPRFLYFVCENIDKHIDYHEKKRLVLEPRAKTYNAVHIGNPI